MTKLPCRECIVLAMCKMRFQTRFNDSKSAISNLYPLSDQCGKLDDYLFEELDMTPNRGLVIDSVRSRRIFETLNFYRGKDNE